jgi:hypothetical protein
MSFPDVTAEAGLAGEGYSMGAAAGDFDDDTLPNLSAVALAGQSFPLSPNLGKRTVSR